MLLLHKYQYFLPLCVSPISEAQGKNKDLDSLIISPVIGEN